VTSSLPNIILQQTVKIVFLFQVGLDVESEAAATYKNVLTKLPGGMKVIEESYYAIQKTVKEMENYIMVTLIPLCHNIFTYLVFDEFISFLFFQFYAIVDVAALTVPIYFKVPCSFRSFSMMVISLL
jgi:hypothetical protein